MTTIRIGDAVYRRVVTADTLSEEQKQWFVDYMEAGFEVDAKEAAIEFGIPGAVWPVLDDAGLRPALREAAREFVENVWVPWYEAATTS